MNEEDLEACFQMFAMVGYLMNGDYTPHEIPDLSCAMAKAMLEARKPKEEAGLPAIRRRVKKSG